MLDRDGMQVVRERTPSVHLPHDMLRLKRVQFSPRQILRNLTIETRDENILARRYFWPGCHRMQPYRDLYPWADAHLPNTNAVAARVIVLPTGMAIGEDEIATICAILRVLHAGA